MIDPSLEPFFYRFLAMKLPNMREQFSEKDKKINTCKQNFLKFEILLIRIYSEKVIDTTWRMPHHLIFFMSTPYVSLSGSCVKLPS